LQLLLGKAKPEIFSLEDLMISNDIQQTLLELLIILVFVYFFFNLWSVEEISWEFYHSFY
jgi:hypothetical protein